MIDYIQGTVAEITLTSVIIDVGGMGYELLTDSFTRGDVEVGESAKLYAHMRIVDDRVYLYGFQSRQLREMFFKLTAISGIGPKVAISILSTLSLQDLTTAVLTEDTKAFQTVPGVGKKTAQRALLELREKVDFSSVEGRDMYIPSTTSDEQGTDPAADAALALEGLGYTRAEALKAIAAVRSLADTPEELIQLALKRFGAK